MDNLIGQVIHNYEVQEVIGRGGMGIVYRAFHPELRKQAAIKILRPDMAHQPGFYERFLQEARTAARLEHPNIVNVLNFGKFEESYYLMMDFIEGPSLRDLIRENKNGMPLGDVILIFQQIADVLAFSHAAGVLHRDLKPDNILLTRSVVPSLPYRAIVTDFGLVKLAENSLLTTQKGVSVGTPAYMSPEQCRGEDVDGRADIYSTGVMLYESLTGKRPYPIRNLFDAAKYHKSEDMVPLRGMRNDVPVPLDNVVRRMLSSDLRHRPKSATEVGHVLRELAQDFKPPTGDAASPIAGRIKSGTGELPPLSEEELKETGTTEEHLAAATAYTVRVTRKDTGEYQMFPVRDKPLIVGRQNDVDIILSHPERYVSKRHCEILLRGGRILIRDLHSTNGSFLGDTRLEPNQFYPWLPSQDIQLGPYTLSLVVEEQLNDGTMASAPEGTVNLDTYVRSRQLHVVCADGQPGRVPLALSPVVLGRLEDCDMTLANPRVSKRHLQVQRKGAVVEITDLRSTNGSFLDNRRLPANEPVIWRPGAVLRLGPYSVTLE